jgi:hypothetical protein
LRESIGKRRKEIKKAEMKIIAEEGAHNLSTGKPVIMKKLTKSFIFFHFLSKPDVIKLIFNDLFYELPASLRHIVISLFKSEKKLFKYFNKKVYYLKENSGIKIIFPPETASIVDQNLKDILNQILSKQRRLIINIVKGSIAESLWDKKL